MISAVTTTRACDEDADQGPQTNLYCTSRGGIVGLGLKRRRGKSHKASVPASVGVSNNAEIPCAPSISHAGLEPAVHLQKNFPDFSLSLINGPRVFSHSELSDLKAEKKRVEK